MSWQVKWFVAAIVVFFGAVAAGTAWWVMRDTSLPTQPGNYLVDHGNACELWVVNASGRINIPVTRCDFGTPGAREPSYRVITEMCGNFSFSPAGVSLPLNTFLCVGCDLAVRPRPHCPLKNQPASFIWTRFTP